MLRQLYDWTLSLARHRHARWALCGVSFAESSFFPVPPDVLLIAMVIADRVKAWSLAFLTTVSSVLGGLAGYAIGYFVFDAVGLPIIEFYGATDKFETLRNWYNEWGAWIVFAAGLTPIPYKIFTIFSGATGLDLMLFVLASAASRGLRFFAVATLLYWVGPPIRDFIERRLGLVFTIFVIGLIGGFVLVRAMM